MDRAGEKLKRVRERLHLTFREVERASQRIAAERGSEEFAIALSRLADIENKGTVPSLYRLYSLCAIYRLDHHEVLGWYGIPLDHLAADGLSVELDATHEVRFGPASEAVVPLPLETEIDWEKTTFLSEFVHRFGKMPLSFLRGFAGGEYRYGLIGCADWSMYPVLHPGALIAIDEKRRKIAHGGWTNELDRPVYFLQLRDGYRCGYCTLRGDRLILQPHPASEQPAEVFEFPREIEVIGQVAGVAMRLESWKRPLVRPAATPGASRDR
jgi:transcriptional regulator with XRE-family HTH domain